MKHVCGGPHEFEMSPARSPVIRLLNVKGIEIVLRVFVERLSKVTVERVYANPDSEGYCYTQKPLFFLLLKCKYLHLFIFCFIFIVIFMYYIV